MEAVETILTQTEVLGNELWRYAMLVGCIVVAYLLAKIIGYFVHKTASGTRNRGRPVLAAALDVVARTVGLAGLLFGISAGMHFLLLPPALAVLIATVLHILGALLVGLLAWRMVEVVIKAFDIHSARTESKLDDMLGPILRTSLRVAVVILVGVQVAQILSDKPVTSIIAGLGIGGLAIALAAQESLKNIFGSIVIFSDKPFQVGDRIIVDKYDGPVEEVGLRSTRIRSHTGTIVTIPNGELANKSIDNISKRPFIRREVNLTLTYDTPAEKVERALAIIRELFATGPNEGGREEGGTINHPDFPPRTYFNDFKADSLNIYVIYWYFPPAWWDFLAFGQWFNLELKKRFEAEGIEFAFPTQTVYLAGDAARPLDIGLRREGPEDAEPRS